MVPREAGRGRSFQGAGQYYLHDKQAVTSERVAFTHTENVPTQDPHKALKWMAWTAMNAEELKRESGAAMTGHSCGKPVFTFSLAWHPEQDPKKWEMVGAGRTALQALGLDEHEALMVSHTDRPHAHMHVIVNVVHPETGKAHSLSYSRLKLSEWAESYERRHGKVYCEQRVENNAKRKEGEYVKYEEPEVDRKAEITELYQHSDCGPAFQAGLAQLGYTLAQGKRPVLIDREGKIHSLYRQIEGVKAADIKARLAGLELPDVDEVRGRSEETAGKKQEAEHKTETREHADQKQSPTDEPADEQPVPFDRDQQDRDWQESIIDAGIEADQAKKKPRPAANALPQASPKPVHRPSPGPLQLNELQNRHHAELGRFYTENTQSRQRLRFTLDQQYGGHERELRQEIAHLDDALTNSGPLRRFWLKLSGQISRNAEEELENNRRTLENVEWRRREAEQALERDVEQRRQAIEARQRSEREALRPDLDSAHLHDYRADPEASVGQHGPDEDHGPSLSY